MTIIYLTKRDDEMTLCSILSSTELLAEKIQRLTAHQAKIGKRWNDRLVLNNLMSPKYYLAGGFVIVVKIESSTSGPTDNSAYVSYECVVRHMPDTSERAAETCLAESNDQEVVFVPIGEIIKCNEGLIESIG